jgi:hypothetical protein
MRCVRRNTILFAEDGLWLTSVNATALTTRTV